MSEQKSLSWKQKRCFAAAMRETKSVHGLCSGIVTNMVEVIVDHCFVTWNF
ncbi:MAG: hypothetical protein M3Y81_00525 [Chloroflexota bacterium]|nr:hypothetical protein [Chloroflexota bacterium]